jgi:hypothetical protein
VYLTLTFFSPVSLILNIIILGIIFFLIARDLKDSSRHKFYIVSLLLTALFFIFSSTGFLNLILVSAERSFLSVATLAGMLAYFFANLAGALFSLYLKIRES